MADALRWVPDAATLDIGAPGKDGYDATRRLRAEMLKQEQAAQAALDRQCKSAFLAVLHNAAKYTPTRGAIALELTRSGRHVEIGIIDDGAGLDTASLERIFDMFAQVDDQKERSQGGLGIGIALTRQLAELHGGSVRAHSDGIGRGCRFAITLPLDAAALPNDQA